MCKYTQGLSASPVLFVDLETEDPLLKTKGPSWIFGEGHILGAAVGGLDAAHDEWLDFRHEGSRRRLKDMLRSGVPVVMHNASYDLGWLQSVDIVPTGLVTDTMHWAALLDENRRYLDKAVRGYGLDALSRAWLKAEGKGDAAIREMLKAAGIKANDVRPHLGALYKTEEGREAVAEYAVTDIDLTRRLWGHMAPRLEAEGLATVLELERDILPITVKMQVRGIRIDQVFLEKRLSETSQELNPLLERLSKLGIFSIHNNDQVAVAFKAEDLDFTLTDTEKPQINEATFTHHRGSELSDTVHRARELDKLRVGINQITEHLAPDGRVHPSWKQLPGDGGGTVSGRFSCKQPAAQTVPPALRPAFLPEEGQLVVSCDYSQQEPRLLVSLALQDGVRVDRAARKRAEEVATGYRDETTDIHGMAAELMGVPRDLAKQLGLALTYGMGIQTLSEELGVSRDEAESLRDRYRAALPFSRQLERQITDVASRRGYVRSILGRRFRFDTWTPVRRESEWRPLVKFKALPLEAAERAYPDRRLERAFTYRALNRYLQGSGADQTKLAMRDVAGAGHAILLTLHDELVVSVADAREAESVKELMENALKIAVPSKVDTHCGAHWKKD